MRNLALLASLVWVAAVILLVVTAESSRPPRLDTGDYLFVVIVGLVIPAVSLGALFKWRRVILPAILLNALFFFFMVVSLIYGINNNSISSYEYGFFAAALFMPLVNGPVMIRLRKTRP